MLNFLELLMGMLLVLHFIQSPVSYSFALLFLVLLLLLLFKSIEVNKVFLIFLFLFVKNEVFSVECGLIVIDLTPRDGKSNTTSTIRALMELPPHTLGAVVTP